MATRAYYYTYRSQITSASKSLKMLSRNIYLRRQRQRRWHRLRTYDMWNVMKMKSGENKNRDTLAMVQATGAKKSTQYSLFRRLSREIILFKMICVFAKAQSHPRSILNAAEKKIFISSRCRSIIYIIQYSIQYMKRTDLAINWVVSRVWCAYVRYLSAEYIFHVTFCFESSKKERINNGEHIDARSHVTVLPPTRTACVRREKTVEWLTEYVCRVRFENESLMDSRAGVNSIFNPNLGLDL